MEARRFDATITALGNGVSRRRVLGILVGGIGSAAFFARGQEAAARVVCDEGTRHCGRNECYRRGANQCCRCPGGVGIVIDLSGVCPACPTV
jgi:hypothetical protein